MYRYYLKHSFCILCFNTIILLAHSMDGMECDEQISSSCPGFKKPLTMDDPIVTTSSSSDDQIPGSSGHTSVHSDNEMEENSQHGADEIFIEEYNDSDEGDDIDDKKAALDIEQFLEAHPLNTLKDLSDQGLEAILDEHFGNEFLDTTNLLDRARRARQQGDFDDRGILIRLAAIRGDINAQMEYANELSKDERIEEAIKYYTLAGCPVIVDHDVQPNLYAKQALETLARTYPSAREALQKILNLEKIAEERVARRQ